MVLSPLDQPNPGTQLYHFVGNAMQEPMFGECHPHRQFPGFIATGDHCGIEALAAKPWQAVPSYSGGSKMVLSAKKGLISFSTIDLNSYCSVCF